MFLFMSNLGFTMPAAHREHGVVMVEFALVLPLLTMLIFGFLKFGVAMNAKIDSTHLTAEGARYIAVNQNPGSTQPTPTTLQDYIRNQADTTELKTATVCVEYPNGTSQVGDPVRVTMNHTYTIIPLFGNLLVTSEATMRLEAVPTNITAGCTS